MKTKSKFRRWGWAYDLDEQAPSALIFDGNVVLTFEPMRPQHREKLKKFIRMLNSRRFVLSTQSIAQRKVAR
jgi:peptidoglycan/xylan/chitin deacetylase (PgdA/CDA1 family)